MAEKHTLLASCPSCILAISTCEGNTKVAYAIVKLGITVDTIMVCYGSHHC